MRQTGWGRATSPFHRGEQELQNRLKIAPVFIKLRERLSIVAVYCQRSLRRSRFMILISALAHD